jgi:catechol 2,3-dioxygenase-like lactoylglutathione lyase family enzyme
MLLHADLYVRAIASSLEFYVAGLGMQLTRDELIDGEPAEQLSRGRHRAVRRAQLRAGPVGLRLQLIEPRDHTHLTPLQRPPHLGALTLLVADLAPRMAQLRTAGFEPASAIFRVEMPRVGTSSIVFYRDPDGHAIELLVPGARSA